jgi:hypothetical protein
VHPLSVLAEYWIRWSAGGPPAAGVRKSLNLDSMCKRGGGGGGAERDAGGNGDTGGAGAGGAGV